MYHSRLNMTNSLVSAALDALTGEPLELVLESTKENILKQNFKTEASPLKVLLSDGRALRPAKYGEIMGDKSLKPTIALSQGEHSACATVDCPALVDMATGERVGVSAQWTLSLPENDCKMHWRMSLHNNTDVMVEKAYLPYLNGIFMGDDWTQDTLYMPVHSGDRTQNPTRTLANTPSVISWKWQEYQFDYTVGGPCGVKNEQTGCYERELMYSGPCSMLYMVLENKALDMLVYLTCRDDALTLKAIRAASYGEARPGVSLAIAHFPCVKRGAWQSDECILMLERGDWHVGADDYRAWRQSVARPEIKRPHRPKWYENSPGLAAHYDFKYQGGGIVHRFKDIPALLDMAREAGLNNLLISGWNKDGFDNGFPMYIPDPELGTEAELREALKIVKERGGHVGFYINSRLCNTRYDELKSLYENGAAMRKDGSLYIEKYGADDLNFACMCAGDSAWQEKLVNTVKYLTRDIGADLMYLDQLGMATGLMCYNKNHRHGERLDTWNDGYEQILSLMRDNYDEEGVALLFEGATDIHARGASGQLISTMFFNGAFPELYKYTFPDDVLVDMMCPASHSGMRPAHIARKSTFLLYRAFVVGSYFWVYDLEEDNTFRRDAQQLDRLKRVMKLRSEWLNAYGHGRFVDTLGLMALPNAKDVLLKRFEMPFGALIACANEHKEDVLVIAAWEEGKPLRAFARTFEAPDEEREIPFERVPGGVRLDLGDTELAYVVLRSD